MTDPKPDEKPTDDKPVDESGALAKLKTLLNEVLDERETKAAAAKGDKEKDDKEPDEKRTTPKRSFMQELFGG